MNNKQIVPYSPKKSDKYYNKETETKTFFKQPNLKVENKYLKDAVRVLKIQNKVSQLENRVSVLEHKEEIISSKNERKTEKLELELTISRYCSYLMIMFLLYIFYLIYSSDYTQKESSID